MIKRIIVFFIVLINILSFGMSKNPYCYVPAEDSLALVALFNSTDGANWKDNSDWLTAPVYDWYGITVTENRVTEITLQENKLTGTIPPEIGNLTDLRNLYLNGNQLDGSIPAEIGNLVNLVNLDLTGNNLTGTIPAAIYDCISLSFLNLSDNELTGSISSDIGNLTNLRVLSLRFNQLDGTIPMEVYGLTKLEIINLSCNQLTGTIPPQIGNLVLLTEFSVPDNKMYGEMPDEIGNLLLIRYLYLHDNNFTGIVPDGIRDMADLTTLRLEDNQFTDLPDISSNISLTKVHIQNNQFTFEDIEPNIGLEGFIYAPQDSVGEKKDTILAPGSSLELSVSVGGTANHYQWTKDGVDIPGANRNTFTIMSAESADEGLYACTITNTIATELTLYSKPADVSVSALTGSNDVHSLLPAEPALYHNYPNPFSVSTRIKYDLPTATHVVLKIYSLSGQEIRTLVNEFQTAGEKITVWDGLNEQGQKVSSGTYIYQIKTESFSKSKPLIIIK